MIGGGCVAAELGARASAVASNRRDTEVACTSPASPALPSAASLSCGPEVGRRDPVRFALGDSGAPEGRRRWSTRKPSVAASRMTSSSALLWMWVAAGRERN